jgi:hypothetical protein
MEMIIIEKQIIDELFYKLDFLQAKVNNLYQNSGIAPQKWVCNQEACFKLNASKRTMQNLRDSGILPFTKMEGKVFYKPEDIEKLMLMGYKSKINKKALK